MSWRDTNLGLVVARGDECRVEPRGSLLTVDFHPLTDERRRRLREETLHFLFARPPLHDLFTSIAAVDAAWNAGPVLKRQQTSSVERFITFSPSL